MEKQQQLTHLVSQAVEADRRNDTAARNRYRAEAVNMYALVKPRTWARRFAAASR